MRAANPAELIDIPSLDQDTQHLMLMNMPLQLVSTKRLAGPRCEQALFVQFHYNVQRIFSIQLVFFLKTTSKKQTMTDEVYSPRHTTAEFMDQIHRFFCK
jgi:hypothetical protein